MRQRERRTDGGMAGHGQLAAGREDAHPVIGTRGIGREDECGLRERHLARNRLHDGTAQIVRWVQIHGQLVAGEQLVGEDVEVQVGEHDAFRWAGRPFRPAGRLRS